MTKAAAIVLCITILAAAALVALAVYQPPAARPNVSLAFSGYTNDNAGTRMATFTLKNNGPWAMNRLPQHSIWIPPPVPRGTRLSEGRFPGTPFLLRAGASETLTIISPTNQTSWKFVIVLGPIESFLRDMSDSISSLLRSVGIRVRQRNGKWAIDSDWVQE